MQQQPQPHPSMNPELIIRIIAGLVGAVGLGALLKWLWSVTRPGVDEFIYRAITRRSQDYEHHLRTEVFRQDIEEREKWQTEISTASRTANEAAANIEIGRLAQDELNERYSVIEQRLNEIIPMCQNIEKIERRQAKIDARARRLERGQARMLGLLSPRPWDGTKRRESDGGQK
jgi:hypothetical protein